MKPLPYFLTWVTLSLFANAGDTDAERTFRERVHPILERHCFECHGDRLSEAEINFESITSARELRSRTSEWLKLVDIVESHQMPPKESVPLSDVDRSALLNWSRDFLKRLAAESAGDPGPVVLRRLNNAEYTYTLQDLTGIETLDPANEFPADSAAGEGFTNTGNAMVMSPALVTKYLDAAKEVSGHMVLLPNRIRFSSSTTRSDWKNESLAAIRNFYSKYADNRGGDSVNLQGIVFDTNQGGRLALDRYVAALIESRSQLVDGQVSIADIATSRSLNPKYLGSLWRLLQEDATIPSMLISNLRQRWKTTTPKDADRFTHEIEQWQRALWRFTSVGHIGKVNGPKAWQEAVNPIASRTEVRSKLVAKENENDIRVYLKIGDAGDGNHADVAVIERPRLVIPGRPDLLLRDVRKVVSRLAAHRQQVIESAVASLDACAAAQSEGEFQIESLANRYGVPVDALSAWIDYLGIRSDGSVQMGPLIRRKVESVAGYEFVQGWVGDDALSIVANASDQHVRIPGNMPPHSVAVHPAPTQSVAVGWKGPRAMNVQIAGLAHHAHPECGNGVAWTLELRRGNTRQQIAQGIAHGPNPSAVGPIDSIAIQPGDLVSLIVNPRDGNHSCDLTTIDLTITTNEHRWNLTEDVATSLLEGNPHSGSGGIESLWYFYSEPTSGATGYVIPAGSALAKWQSSQSNSDRALHAGAIERLLKLGPKDLPIDSPDRALYQQLTSMGGPLMAAALNAASDTASSAIPLDSNDGATKYGLDGTMFGAQADEDPIEPASMRLTAPSLVEILLPAELAAGAELVFAGYLDPEQGREGSVQVQLLDERPSLLEGMQPMSVAETNANGLWSSNNRGVSIATPVLVQDGSSARDRIEQAFDDFRAWFPIALCYTKIVPVDEVVTLTLFYREDEPLQRLMLDDQERAMLDQMWDELHFVSGDALTLVDAYEQLWQFATQDADPSAFEPLREPILKRAADYRRLLVDSEEIQIAAAMGWIEKSYRRPVTADERAMYVNLYHRLRSQELTHEDSIRLMFARALVSPDFLYRIERPGPGPQRAPLSDWELASRLSYFLWSSAPDDTLRQLADAGALHREPILRAQVERMLRDRKSRRLATEFACHWLDIYDFKNHDEKSERHFPTFAGLRESMHEESVLFMLDMFRENRPLLEIIDADHTFLNEALASHYGIPGIEGAHWRRVDGVRRYHRGGILGMATVLSKQSGASRTSPILRGNWLSEVVLGEKLPKPPKNVPVLAESAPQGMTERQMIERHSQDAACSKCHARIDPFGFALEAYDAIGRFRELDANGLPIDTVTRLPDGTELHSLESLRMYLNGPRRDAIAKQFHRKLLGYALGRSIQLSDLPLLDELTRASLDDSQGMVQIVERIVRSDQFRDIRGRDFVESP